MDEVVESIDVLIVGAGPTGLSLAAQLRRFGLRPMLIDRLSDRVHESRALAIQPRSLEILRAFGVAERATELGNGTVALRVHARGRAYAVPLFDHGLEDTEYPFLLFLSQASTEALLVEHLSRQGVQVERDLELLDLADRGDFVDCRLRRRAGSEDGDEDSRSGAGRTGEIERIRASWVVGCDGAHSTVRNAAGVSFEGDSYPQTFALADVDVDGALEYDCVHAFLGPPGMLFFFPLGKPAPWRLQCVLKEREGTDGDEPPLASLQEIVDSFTDRGLRLRDPAWKTRFRVHHRHAASYRVGRVFLAGDAAHVHSPAGAQGMNTGIQDAWNLGWKLALVVQGRAEPTLLDSYEAERMPVGRSVLRLSDRPFRLATSESWPFHFARSYVAPLAATLATRMDALRGRAYRRLSQLDVGYRPSPVVEEGRPSPSGGPRAGDRVPDATVTLDGETTSLQRRLDGARFHLVLCGRRRAWGSGASEGLRDRFAPWLAVHHLTSEPGTGMLVDVEGRALARLGVTGVAHYLVRPDHHVMYRAAGTDLQPMAHHLARWLT